MQWISAAIREVRLTLLAALLTPEVRIGSNALPAAALSEMIKMSSKKHAKKAMAFEVVIKAVILLLVMGVVIYVFIDMFGGGADNAQDKIDQTSLDWDGDGIPNILDNCCCTDESDAEHTDATGCSPACNKLSCSAKEAQECNPEKSE